MGIRIYRKAGYKAVKNTNKKDQVSCNGEKKTTYLSQSIATTFKKESCFFFFALFIFVFLFISTLVSIGKYRHNLSFSVQTLFFGF